MYTRISELSAFVLDLNAQAQDRGVSDLVAWAVASLSDRLGFDCAWYGWAQLQTSGAVIHANTTYNLPQDYYPFWMGMADQDVLVDQLLNDPFCVATYDRKGNIQSDGMEHLSDAFGLRKMATAMCLRPERTASFYMSAYRGGDPVRPWSSGECEFLKCAVDNISAAAGIAAGNDLQSLDGQAASIFMSPKGATIVGLNRLRERFGHLWTRSDGDRVPRWLAEYVDRPGEHLLLDQELVATCEPYAAQGGMGWHKMTLRPLQKYDFLTSREREVATALADGHSHKEVARLLGIAPSTVRNQTQAIYRKLGIDNRASLGKHLPARLV